MATNIPPHNLREVAGAVTAYIDNPEIDMAGLMEYVKGPDFPGGGIMSREGIRDAYASGRGSIKVRARAHVEPLKGGKEAIVVTELPFMVKKGGDGGLVTKIADLVRDKKLEGISDLRDESDRSGMRLVIELKRGGPPAKVVLNNLYKKTSMQTTFGANMVALVDGVPKTLSLLELVHHYVQHQREVVTRRTQYELRRAEARAHILEGLLIALDNLDAVIKLIRASSDPDAARLGLIEKFELTREQAQAILDMRLQRLTALEADKVRAEHADLMERIGELRAILGEESRIFGLVKEELAEVVESYGDERRTELAHFEGDVGIEDMIADQQMVISLTASGYVKRLPLATYRQQHRGGVGVMGMNMKEDDYIAHLHICSTHDFLLFFTNRGKVYRLKVYELPEGSRTAKGSALVNLLPLREGEKVMAVIPTRDFKENKYLAFATAKGQIKKTEFLAYNTPIRADGIIAIKVREGDELVQIRLTSGNDDILMVSHSGHASRFSEELVRPMGRDTSGIKGMNVSDKGNCVLAMDIARDDTELFVVTENGYGKRTPVAEYPVKGRGTKGVLTAKLTEKKGGLAGALIVREHQELLFISQNGMVQRTSVSGISQMGRPTQGVKVMNIKDDDRVSAVALVVDSGESEEPARRGGSTPRRPGLGGGGQVLLPGRRDPGAGHLDEDGWRRRLRRCARVHLDLSRQPIALAAVAGRASGDDVLPDRLAAPAPGDHMVDGQPGLAGAAVLTGPSIAGQYRPPSDLAPVRLSWNPYVIDQPNHVGRLHGHPLRMQRPALPLQQLRFLLKEQHSGPSQRANVDRLIRRIENQDTCHGARGFYAARSGTLNQPGKNPRPERSRPWCEARRWLLQRQRRGAIPRGRRRTCSDPSPAAEAATRSARG